MALLAFAPGYLVPMLATLFGIYALTRILSPGEYGNYAFVMSIMLLAHSGLLSWIDLGSKRFFEHAAQRGSVSAMCVTPYLCLLICSVALLISCAIGLQLFHVPPGMVVLVSLGFIAIIAKEASRVSRALELAALSRSRYVLMPANRAYRRYLGAFGGLRGCANEHLAVPASVADALSSLGCSKDVGRNARHVRRAAHAGLYEQYVGLD
jgi:hypothetical protein